MEGIVAMLTDEQQALIWAVRLAGIAALGACLAGAVGLYFHRYASRKRGFVGDVPMQLGKSPVRSVPIGSSLPVTDVLASFPLRTFANIGQVLQADETMWMLVYDATTDDMVAVLFQPSLSSTNHHQTAGRGASAFLL